MQEVQLNMMVSYLALGVIQCFLLASVCSSDGDFTLIRPTYSVQYRVATLIAIIISTEPCFRHCCTHECTHM